MTVSSPIAKFLVVDDQRSVRDYVKAILAVFEAEIVDVASGEEAVKLIAERQFDIVFLDINMAGMSGLAVCEKVRRELHFQHLPIIIMTAIESPDVLEQAFAAGATDYVKKDLLRFELLPRVRAIMGRRNAERAMYLAKREAENANQAKSDFIASMSHELRTPLNAIIGFADLLVSDADTPPNEYQREYLGHINQAGWHLLRLINDILDLAKIESGQIGVELGNVDVAALADDCIRLNQALAGKHGVVLENRLPAGTERRVTADSTRLKQVLINFLSNAVKYNRKGGTASIAVEPRPENRLRIAVTDSGAGIPEQRLAELFQPFSRLGAEKTDVEGHGIGLALTKRLVELMGGTIGVDSVLGQGSTFWVEFARAGSVPTKPSPSAGTEAGGLEQALSALQGKRVLYIEDNAINRALITKILSKYPGIELRCAETGEAGLAVMDSFRPDLLLLDMQLPGISGKDVLDQVRPRFEIPVLVFSADAMPERIQEAMNAGASDYITKPLDVAKLKRLLAELL